MRLLHTADWHLGHTLREHTREAEHAHFLHWLADTIVARQVDALLIAGDVFDSSNPPASAWRAWFEFLGECKRRRPALQIVVIAGNHDSAARLEAPRDLLVAFDVRVVGSVVRDQDGRLATGDLLVPLRDADGKVAAVCAAIPFLRSSDVQALVPERNAPAVALEPGRNGDYVLPRPADAAPDAGKDGDGGDPLVDGMRVLHDELFAAARKVLAPGQALVAMAHGYLVGGALSELSERKVFGGNQHALPIDLFPPDCAYVALGHLHRPQMLGGHDHVRYSGSPVPLSMPEREHAHHVVFADLDGDRLEKVWSLRPRDPLMADELRPLLEVAIRLPQPAPGIGERIARVVAEKNARLVRVDVALAGALNDEAARGTELQSLTPEQVFVRRYHRDHPGDVPEPLLAAFRELLDGAQHEGPK
jgi:exonuclease SbcD